MCMKIVLGLNNLQWLICHKIKPNPGSNTPIKQQFYAHLPTISKVIQVNEQDMLDTAREARINS